MKAYLRAFVSKSYWRYCFSLPRALGALLSAFGVLWLLVEMVSFFSSDVGEAIHRHWGLFLFVGVVSAMWQNRPNHRFACRLNNRDVSIEIVVADIFSCEGALIVGTNTTFDTEISDTLISSQSIQGQFTQKYYQDVRYLDHDLNEQLKGFPHESALQSKMGKQRVYDIGTVVRLTPGGRHAYLVAIARINPFGVAGSAFEDLRNSLGKLWDFIAERGSMEPLVIPVLGSGFSRLTQTRVEIIREIIKSFAAACASKQFAQRLTIAISPKDFYECEIDLSELAGFLRHIAQYTEYRKPTDTGTGTGLGLADEA